MMNKRRDGSTRVPLDEIPEALLASIRSGPTVESELRSPSQSHRNFEPSFERLLGDAEGHDDLPEDLYKHASRRLLTIALAICVTWLFLFAWLLLTTPADSPRFVAPESRGVLIAVTVAAMLGSGALAARVIGRSLTTRQLYRTGLTYFLFVAMCAAINEHFALWGKPPGGWSATSLLIILFPVVVPVAPRRAVFVGLLITLADIFGFGVARLFGHPEIGLVNALNLLRDNIAATVLSYGAAHIIFGLGREIASARRVGGYQLEARLGEGGMGEVWRGRHAMLARPAAIKLIRSKVAKQLGSTNRDVLKRRFALEVQATSSLRSPHTVAIYDFGMSQDGTLYYVMELLEGMDLEKLTRQHGALPPERVLFVLLQVCHSLREAHGRGMVHRDLKPSNVFLCRYGADFDFVKVLDFGLVKLLSQADPGLTAIGTVTGTPSFMAPEQVARMAVDARSDIYLVGCLAYYLLTGELVFPGPTPRRWMQQHARETPQRPSRRAPAPVPEALERVVMRCLEKDPDARPRSAEALIEELRAVERGLARPWTQARARAWWIEHAPALSGEGFAMDADTGVSSTPGRSLADTVPEGPA